MYTEHSNMMHMDYCIKLAKNDLQKGQYALAAIVVDRNGTIISESASKLISGCDPTAHPEIVALRLAAEKLKSRYLPGCYLYTTLEPCPMCTAAAIWAKLDGIVFGAYQTDAIQYSKEHPSNIFTWRQIQIPAQDIANKGTPTLKIVSGIRREECLELFTLCY